MPRLFRVPTGCWIIFYIYLFIYLFIQYLIIFYIYLYTLYLFNMYLINSFYLSTLHMYLFICLFINICLLYKASGRSLKTSQISWDFYRQIYGKNVWFAHRPLLKFSLIVRFRGLKQKKWINMVIQFPLFVSSKPRCQAEF